MVNAPGCVTWADLPSDTYRVQVLRIGYHGVAISDIGTGAGEEVRVYAVLTRAAVYVPAIVVH